MMRVAVDAMGGDHAPAAVVEGAVAAARAHKVPIVLVGDAARIEFELDQHRARGLDIRVHHASDTIGMAEHGAKAIRRKKDSSLRVCFELVTREEAGAVVSAGNSGAVMAGALLILGRLPGVDRPAIVSAMPTLAGGRMLLLDSGANPEAKATYLAQWGQLGSLYAQRVLGVESPRIALLSNGEEAEKGTQLTREAAALLLKTPVNYIGYLEGRDAFSGRCDVLLTDGFTGNVFLKTVEGAAVAMAAMMKQEIEASAAARTGYFLMRGALGRFKRRLDYAEYGGAPVLGVKGVAIVAHGASNATAIKNAIRVARDLAREELGEGFSKAARAATVAAD